MKFTKQLIKKQKKGLRILKKIQKYEGYITNITLHLKNEGHIFYREFSPEWKQDKIRYTDKIKVLFDKFETLNLKK